MGTLFICPTQLNLIQPKLNESKQPTFLERGWPPIYLGGDGYLFIDLSKDGHLSTNCGQVCYPLYPPTRLQGGGDDYPSTYLGDGHRLTDLGGDGHLSIHLKED